MARYFAGNGDRRHSAKTDQRMTVEAIAQEAGVSHTIVTRIGTRSRTG